MVKMPCGKCTEDREISQAKKNEQNEEKNMKKPQPSPQKAVQAAHTRRNGK